MAGMGKRSRRRGRTGGSDRRRDDARAAGWHRDPTDRLVADASAGRRGAIAELARAWDAGHDVGAALDRCLRPARSAATALGWVDGELARIAGKRGGGEARHLAMALAESGDVGDRPVAGPWRRRRRLTGDDAVRVALGLARLFTALPAPLGGRPSASAGAAPSAGRDVDAAVLERVRALLAKAESTTFHAEAEALSAKAHQLMARHAIDRAMVLRGDDDGVGSRRIGIDDPYAVAKVQLLAQVADACNCRAIWSEPFALVTVFGHAADLDTVELLHTSLLVQATTAMLAAGADRAGHRSRSRGFRSSFLLAYAHRVGERLRQVTAATVAEAASDHGDALLPVLASRIDAVEAAVREACPHLVTRRTSIADDAGWAAGTAAASHADLSARLRPVHRKEAAGRLTG